MSEGRSDSALFFFGEREVTCSHAERIGCTKF